VDKRVRMYHGSGTVDRNDDHFISCRCRLQADAAAYVAASHVMAAVLKVWISPIRNPTSSLDVYLLEEQSCQISPRCDLKRWNLKLFEERRPN